VPPSVTVTLPFLQVQKGAVAEQLAKLEVSSLMVLVLPTTSRKNGLRKLDLIVPLSKFPVEKVMLLANAALGTAKAKSVKSIGSARLILPPCGTVLAPHFKETQTVSRSYCLRRALSLVVCKKLQLL